MKSSNQPKILLIYPPITKFERYSSAIGASGGLQIPLGIYYLASFIRQHKYETAIIDAEAYEVEIEEIISQIKAESYNVVGISTSTVAFHRALLLAEAIKSEIPETITVVGGPHVSSQPTQPLELNAFDFAVQNEGEETFLELLQYLESDKTSFENIEGLVFRRDGKTVVNPQRSLISDIDSIPFPAYDLIPDISTYTPPPSNYKKSPVSNIITTRGCPNLCTFCDNNTFGRKTRMRSAENVVSEIEVLVNTYGVKEIAFVDDTFTLDRKRIYEIFDLANSRNLKFPWTCLARINTVDWELLSYMKKNGCWHISFGIESGDESILKAIRKNISLPAVKQVIDMCHKIGILTKGFFIVGHPTETLETINKTIAFSTSLKLDDIVVTINTPILGSDQYKNIEKYGTIDTTDWAKFNYWNPVFVPEGLTRELILAKHKEFYRKFYFRPRILWRYFLSAFSLTGIKRIRNLLKSSLFLFQKNI